VFDGHGGVEAANYCSTHLVGHLARCIKDIEEGKVIVNCSFFIFIFVCLKLVVSHPVDFGCTGVIILLDDDDDRLFIAWLGDSQALLVRGGKPVEIMRAHKPEREDEKARITSLGGSVVHFGTWRVNGALSVSRAVGGSLLLFIYYYYYCCCWVFIIIYYYYYCCCCCCCCCCDGDVNDDS
ncbi:hypothetical protein HELRODRAFT_85873, partial [Helobdella robusta]|uniref:PPM-type phosphatase domain-containing protein n=1 Tax=Helobdella robusta TaxID=6412 RepID=T1G638_HELRO